jgi:hypothetical protein
MQRIALAALVAFAVAPAFAQQTAGEVYQWKDANGVTHYSQTPPAKGSYEQRVITSTGSAAPVGAEPVADAANAQCTAARENLEALKGEGDVMQDTNGDGTPDTVLNAEQRANQLELAQAAAKAYCTP